MMQLFFHILPFKINCHFGRKLVEQGSALSVALETVWNAFTIFAY
jgi:hypothetical protein